MAAPEQLFNVRERKRFERHDIWERIAENGTISAAVMVFAAIAAVICANTDAYEAIHHFLETPLYVGLGNLTAGLTVELFVNDFLMAIFFLLVGIELKYEMTVGELKNPRQAMLPMLAAVGGVVVPACIYLIFNHAGAHNGWAIPMQPILPSHWACCRFWAIACPTACACSSRRSPSPTTSSLSPPSPSSTVRAPIRFGWAPPRL